MRLCEVQNSIRRGAADLNQRVVTRHGFKLGRLGLVGDHPIDMSAFDPVRQICRGQLGGTGDQHRTELNASEHGFP